MWLCLFLMFDEEENRESHGGHFISSVQPSGMFVQVLDDAVAKLFEKE